MGEIPDERRPRCQIGRSGPRIASRADPDADHPAGRAGLRVDPDQPPVPHQEEGRGADRRAEGGQREGPARGRGQDAFRAEHEPRGAHAAQRHRGLFPAARPARRDLPAGGEGRILRPYHQQYQDVDDAAGRHPERFRDGLRQLPDQLRGGRDALHRPGGDQQRGAPPAARRADVLRAGV